MEEWPYNLMMNDQRYLALLEELKAKEILKG